MLAAGPEALRTLTEQISLTHWLMTARQTASSFSSGPRSTESVIKNSVGIG